MEFTIESRPAASVLRLNMDQGDTITCEVGAMIAMSTGLTVETAGRKKGSTGGGLLKSIKRMFAGENYFLNYFTSRKDDQTLVMGPKLMGDIIHHELDGTLIVQGSSWLASGEGIELDATFQGLGKALFSGESVFWLKCTGQGDLFLSSFGAIYSIDVDGEYTVDTGHIVAFEDSLKFRIGKASHSLIGSFLGGEGLVCKFSGRGKLYCQSHNPPSFGGMLGPKLKPR